MKIRTFCRKVTPIIFCLTAAAAYALELPASGIIADVKNARIDHAEVLVTKEGMEYRASLNEERLEKLGSVVKIKQFSQDPSASLLIKIIAGAKANATNKSLDLRYGCKFYDSDGKLIHTMYVDLFWKRGKLDGNSVVFPGKIRDWFKTVSKESFQTK